VDTNTIPNIRVAKNPDAIAHVVINAMVVDATLVSVRYKDIYLF
jgi:hypothetical protein